jgi:hypothetical protein
MHNEVFDGFARAIWDSAYASGVEELVDAGVLARTPWRGGDDISKFTPSPPKALADRVSLLFESKLDDARTQIESAYDVARDERYDAPRDAEEFGWQMGMAWVGTGVAVPNAGRKLLKKLGHGEFALDIALDRTGAPGKATITYTSLPELPRVEANRRRASRRRTSRRR